MSRRQTIGWTAVLSAVFLAGAMAAADVPFDPSPQSAEELYQSALLKKEAEGNLDGAIKLFQSVIVKFPDNKDVAARAQLQIGLCYEKLGKAEAVKAYELVVERYSGQKEQVAAARARLAELKKGPPKDLSITRLGGWERAGMYIQPVEISADGASFVGVEFVKGQNIVVGDIAAKKVRYITDYTWSMEGYSYAYNPALSPDGKEIAFFSSFVSKDEQAVGHSLIVATLDGRSRVLAKDKNEWHAPMGWLPDGSAILTIRSGADGAAQLGLVPRQGGAFTRLATFRSGQKTLGAQETSASVSPDGRYVVYTDAAAGEKSDIYIVGSKGGNSEPLLKHPAEEKFPRWSPDGNHVVFLSLRHGSWALWGTAVKNGRATGDPFMIRDGMKDSTLMNWTAGGLASWDHVSMRDIYLMDVDPATGEPAGDPRQIEYAPTGSNGGPIWSPDGKSFAFIRAVPGAGGIFVVITGKDKKEFQVPTASGQAGLKWSPDGTAIGKILADENKKWFLYALNVGSGTWKQTPVPVDSYTPFDWGGAGNVIFFSKPGAPEQGAGIVELNLETGAERYIYRPDKNATLVVRWMDASWDHKRLAFIEINPSADGFDLKVVNLETGEVLAQPRDFASFAWSPDGRRLVGNLVHFSKGSKQSLFIVPETGGPAKEVDLSKKLPPRSMIGSQDWSPDGRKIILALEMNASEVLLFRNLIPPDK